jgi:hypothetical protein
MFTQFEVKSFKVLAKSLLTLLIQQKPTKSVKYFLMRIFQPFLPGTYKSQVLSLTLDEVRPDFFVAAPRE